MQKVIHVDNSEFFRKLMKTFLHEHGFQMVSYSSGMEALSEINAGKASVVITGMSLSDMDGEEFIKKIATSRYKVPIIAVTSNDIDEENEKLRMLGVKAQIHKAGAWHEQLLQYLADV